MHAYCTQVKNFSDDEAFKRIHVARTARRFPGLFVALADGRLHLSAVRLLATHLTPENVERLVEAASHRSCAEIQFMVDQQIVRLEALKASDSKSQVATASPTPTKASNSTPTSETRSPASDDSRTPDLAFIDPPQAARPVDRDPGPDAQTPAAKEAAPQPSVWVVLEKKAHDKLEYARALLSHRMPLASASQVLERALDDLIATEETRKFAATTRPRAARRKSSQARFIPAHVKRTVWKRDQGRCTFVGTSGQRCASRMFLEFDHVEPVARGGKATIEGMRLRCRAHNQYEAERMFGAEFMRRKREAKRQARAQHKAVESRAVPDQGGNDGGMALGVGRIRDRSVDVWPWPMAADRDRPERDGRHRPAGSEDPRSHAAPANGSGAPASP